MKRPLKIGLIVGGAVALLAITIAVNVSRLHSTVRDVVVDISHDGTPLLVSAQTVKDSVLSALPHIHTIRVADVDREDVAAAAMNVPFVRSATVTVSVSGKVIVKAEQRRPIARLYYGSREYYFDDDGYVFPTSTMGDCDVIVAGGDFAEPLHIDSLNSQMLALVRVAGFLDSNKAYLSLVDQIYSQSVTNVVVVPKLGNVIIDLGQPQNLEAKFANLFAFYSNGLPKAGWSTYSRISLKYDGQVVCTKR